jgi:hypothetical protein
MRNLVFILILLSLTVYFSCDKHAYFDGDETYFDDFESYQSFDDLVDSPQNFYYQITYDESFIRPDTTKHLSGKQAMYFYGHRTENDLLSKCSFSNHHMAFWEGETVYASANYYIDSKADLPWLFLLDMEERAAIGAGPGIRVFISEDNAFGLNFKYLEPNIKQADANAIFVPRQTWFKLSMEVYLTQKKSGWVKVYQNDTLLIHAEDVQTLPTDILYFQQGTKGMYNSVEFGLTANPTDEHIHLYLDDVEVFKVQ